ncbi:hypothetical protein HKD37_14G039541 [Glycine soja]
MLTPWLMLTPPPMSTPLPMSTLSPTPTPPLLPPPIPMPTGHPCPAPVQPFLPPLLGPLPMPALYLPNLGFVRTAISFNKRINTIPLYDHATVSNDKPWKNKDMALFEMGHVSYETAMAVYKLQPVAFALCTTAKQGAIRRNRPWDPGIVFGSHSLKPQHLENKVFLMGQRMLGSDKEPKTAAENIFTKPEARVQGEMQEVNKPKRKITKSSYFKDFV